MKMKAFILAACMLLSSAAVFADTYEEKKQIVFLFMEAISQEAFPEGEEEVSCIASEEESVLGYGSFIFGVKGHEEELFLFEIIPLDPSMIYIATFSGDSDAVERDTVADFIRRTDAVVSKMGEYTVYSSRDERYVKTPKGAYLRSKVRHVPYAAMKAEVNPKLKDL